MGREFHHRLAVADDHPDLLRLLGLIVDLEVTISAPPGGFTRDDMNVRVGIALHAQPQADGNRIDEMLSLQTACFLNVEKGQFYAAETVGSRLMGRERCIDPAKLDTVQWDLESGVRSVLRQHRYRSSTTAPDSGGGLPRSYGISVFWSGREREKFLTEQMEAVVANLGTKNGKRECLTAEDLVLGFVPTVKPRPKDPKVKAGWHSLTRRRLDLKVAGLPGRPEFNLSWTDEMALSPTIVEAPQPVAGWLVEVLKTPQLYPVVIPDGQTTLERDEQWYYLVATVAGFVVVREDVKVRHFRVDPKSPIAVEREPRRPERRDAEGTVWELLPWNANGKSGALENLGLYVEFQGVRDPETGVLVSAGASVRFGDGLAGEVVKPLIVQNLGVLAEGRSPTHLMKLQIARRKAPDVVRGPAEEDGRRTYAYVRGALEAAKLAAQVKALEDEADAAGGLIHFQGRGQHSLVVIDPLPEPGVTRPDSVKLNLPPNGVTMRFEQMEGEVAVFRLEGGGLAAAAEERAQRVRLALPAERSGVIVSLAEEETDDDGKKKQPELSPGTLYRVTTRLAYTTQTPAESYLDPTLIVEEAPSAAFYFKRVEFREGKDRDGKPLPPVLVFGTSPGEGVEVRCLVSPENSRVIFTHGNGAMGDFLAEEADATVSNEGGAGTDAGTKPPAPVRGRAQSSGTWQELGLHLSPLDRCQLRLERLKEVPADAPRLKYHVHTIEVQASDPDFTFCALCDGPMKGATGANAERLFQVRRVGQNGTVGDRGLVLETIELAEDAAILALPAELPPAKRWRTWNSPPKGALLRVVKDVSGGRVIRVEVMNRLFTVLQGVSYEGTGDGSEGRKLKVMLPGGEEVSGELDFPKWLAKPAKVARWRGFLEAAVKQRVTVEMGQEGQIRVLTLEIPGSEGVKPTQAEVDDGIAYRWVMTQAGSGVAKVLEIPVAAGFSPDSFVRKSGSLKLKITQVEGSEAPSMKGEITGEHPEQAETLRVQVGTYREERAAAEPREIVLQQAGVLLLGAPEDRRDLRPGSELPLMVEIQYREKADGDDPSDEQKKQAEERRVKIGDLLTAAKKSSYPLNVEAEVALFVDEAESVSSDWELLALPGWTDAELADRTPVLTKDKQEQWFRKVREVKAVLSTASMAGSWQTAKFEMIGRLTAREAAASEDTVEVPLPFVDGKTQKLKVAKSTKTGPEFRKNDQVVADDVLMHWNGWSLAVDPPHRAAQMQEHERKLLDKDLDKVAAELKKQGEDAQTKLEALKKKLDDLALAELRVKAKQAEFEQVGDIRKAELLGEMKADLTALEGKAALRQAWRAEENRANDIASKVEALKNDREEQQRLKARNQGPLHVRASLPRDRDPKRIEAEFVNEWARNVSGPDLVDGFSETEARERWTLGTKLPPCRVGWDYEVCMRVMQLSGEVRPFWNLDAAPQEVVLPFRPFGRIVEKAADAPGLLRCEPVEAPLVWQAVPNIKAKEDDRLKGRHPAFVAEVVIRTDRAERFKAGGVPEEKRGLLETLLKQVEIKLSAPPLHWHVAEQLGAFDGAPPDATRGRIALGTDWETISKDASLWGTQPPPEKPWPDTVADPDVGAILVTVGGNAITVPAARARVETLKIVQAPQAKTTTPASAGKPATYGRKGTPEPVANGKKPAADEETMAANVVWSNPEPHLIFLPESIPGALTGGELHIKADSDIVVRIHGIPGEEERKKILANPAGLANLLNVFATQAGKEGGLLATLQMLAEQTGSKYEPQAADFEVLVEGLRKLAMMAEAPEGDAKEKEQAKLLAAFLMHPWVSTPRVIRIRHITNQPFQAPQLMSLRMHDRRPGQTDAFFKSIFQLHRPSTGSLLIQAALEQEYVDDPRAALPAVPDEELMRIVELPALRREAFLRLYALELAMRKPQALETPELTPEIMPEGLRAEQIKAVRPAESVTYLGRTRDLTTCLGRPPLDTTLITPTSNVYIKDHGPDEEHFDFGQEFNDTRHRTVYYRGIAHSRFGKSPEGFGLLGEDVVETAPATLHRQQATDGWSQVEIPATVAPKDVNLKGVDVIFEWSGGVGTSSSLWTKGAPGAWQFNRTRRCGHRIRMERPWYSSGSGEKLAVLLWRDPEVPWEEGQEQARLVSRWGVDPVFETQLPSEKNGYRPGSGLGALTREDFIDPWSAPLGLKSRPIRPENTDAPAQPVVAAGAGRPGVLGTAEAKVDPGDGKMIPVGLAVFSPKFDPKDGSWYADVFVEPRCYSPFVSYTVARYQPCSLPECALSNPRRLDMLQVLPGRTLTLTGRCLPMLEIEMELAGIFPDQNRRRISVKVECNPYYEESRMEEKDNLTDEEKAELEKVNENRMKPGEFEFGWRPVEILDETGRSVREAVVMDPQPGPGPAGNFITVRTTIRIPQVPLHDSHWADRRGELTHGKLKSKGTAWPCRYLRVTVREEELFPYAHGMPDDATEGGRTVYMDQVMIPADLLAAARTEKAPPRETTKDDTPAPRVVPTDVPLPVNRPPAKK